MSCETATTRKSKSKNKQQRFNLFEAVHASEASFHLNKHPSHNFEIILEPASFSEEKYDLYVKYQLDIHNDTEKEPHQFERFLVTTPLTLEDIPYPSPPPAHLPKKYGSYHQLYRLDGKLIAMSVLDVLPSCVSSVYFMYDKAWERFSLGKVSVLREVSMAKEIHDAGIPDMKYVYMGFYIQSCQKMRYKGDYHPSYLLDPESYDWYPLEKCLPVLEQNRYACFSEPTHSIAGDPPQDVLLDTDVLDNILILVRIRQPDDMQVLYPVYKTNLWKYDEIKEEYDAFIEGLGTEVAQKVVSKL
ncbi:hypothetical protein AGABI2DRAFT_202585 [Agaricus bisporus var. bisporus H97]|uniref:hypothetical protein n=1 Tax=Agaricus bisporus var. bisporus (strain H97 / ATCC MYA-4626 / FGSC 10389) TaxID=936046 RepID=UPI00029F7F7B|nr:hypothetical protein AGABI2DRAFT_202585 [Agaricus bisporus var. bisporus H97]EKV48143.1 hypothetical protein AGABI2DRAFT_202585 [Agaricus bisporus var. bisporus H97]